MKLERSPPTDQSLLADHPPAPPTSSFSPPQGHGYRERFYPAGPASHSPPSFVAKSVSGMGRRIVEDRSSGDEDRYPRSISRDMNSVLSPVAGHSAPRGAIDFRLPPIAAWKGAAGSEQEIGQQKSHGRANNGFAGVVQRSPPSIRPAKRSPSSSSASSSPHAITGDDEQRGQALATNHSTATDSHNADQRPRGFQTQARGMAFDERQRADRIRQHPEYEYRRVDEVPDRRIHRDGGEWSGHQDHRSSLPLRTSPYDPADGYGHRSPLQRPEGERENGEGRSMHRQDGEPLPSIVQRRGRMISPELKRPRLPSLHRVPSQSPHSAPATESSRSILDSLPRMEERASLHQTSSESRLPLSAHQPSHNSQASSFMASLLRAAQTTPEGQSPQVNSPMSVLSIVEGQGSSPQTERRTRKRRTSSVQEPLQGSALEAATRAQSFPRRSEHSHYRGHASDAGLDRSPREYMHPVPAARPQPHDVRSPMSESAYHQHFDSHDTAARSQRWHGSSDEDGQRYGSYELAPAHSRYEGTYPPSHTGQGPAHGGHVHPGYNGYPPPPVRHAAPAEYSQGPAEYGYAYADSHTAYRERISHDGHAALHARPSYGVKPPTTGSMVVHGPMPTIESVHWNSELASRAWSEQERWIRLSLNDRRQQVLQSIWNARARIGSTNSYWPPKASNVTTIRCMYANIAQKSYGTEKRFLCPPPVVKISGPLRPCKWVKMRVTLGDSAVVPSSSISVGSSGALGTVAGGEEQAVLDSHAEARFGKLHVGSVSDATSKVFRLQINLLRAESMIDNAKGGGGGGGGQRAIQEISGPLNLPSHAWATFHSSPINVISKPARKSVRTRAASPAIASGSVVCLYNRLNSQTVRTKYLGVETGSITDADHREVARKLVARQEGWEGFAIELLARPLHDPAVARVKARGASSEEWGITYGSIVCLRDVNSKLCSDPMLICKVDKGRVELSSVTGDGGSGKVRFQIVSKNREEAREILFGGARKKAGAGTTQRTSSSSSDKAERGQREGSNASSGSINGSPVAGSNSGSQAAAGVGQIGDGTGSMGGPVIQMQKVTLMHVVPKPTAHSLDEIECDLSTPRAYLCSTACESARDEPIQPVLVRSRLRMQLRSDSVLRGAVEVPLDVADAPVEPAANAARSGGAAAAAAASSSLSPTDGSSTAAGVNASPVPSSTVGFTCPPNAKPSTASGQIDLLEDQFCWTIVTISCTEVSYIDANAPADAISVYPHLPCSPLPVTPFPCLAAQPTYDVRSHSISATVHDFLCADGLDGSRHPLNTVSAVHSVPNKVAHEIWLAHSGPLSTHASSAGPYMSDITVQLPGVDKLAALHMEFYGTADDSAAQLDVIQLPILFVRVGQGVSFPSGHWLLAERAMNNPRDVRMSNAWTIRII